MSRMNAAFVGLAILSLAAIPSAVLAGNASASSYSYGYDDEADRLSWALVSGNDKSTSDMDEMDSLDKLKSEYGDEFLYVRQGQDRYVIRDRGLLERAHRATEAVGDAGRAIGESAMMRVKLALGDSREGRERARLARRIARISRDIARRERDGEDTEDLEKQQEELQQQIDEMGNETHDSAESRQDEARSRDASRRMREATRHLREEMRDILHDAKARHLATRVGSDWK